jgi:uncharacterized protein YjbI with pentapeptide repeats
MSKGPRAPYPPDLDEAQEPSLELGDLVDAVVKDADWANQRPPRLALKRVEVRQTRLTGAELSEATLTDVVFDDCRLDLTTFRFAKLERVVFRDCLMTECDLYEASIKDVLFERCNLRESTLSSTKIERVELRGCELDGLQGIEALRTARMTWNDVLSAAPLFAQALGIEIVD